MTNDKPSAQSATVSDANAKPAAGLFFTDAMRAELIRDTGEVFDRNGPYTPQIARDVIEYVDSALRVLIGKSHDNATAAPVAVSHGESSPVWSEAERRIGALLQAAWSNAEKSHGVTLYPTSYEATFRDMARAVLQDLATPAAIVAELDKAKDELSRLHALVAAHEAEKAQAAPVTAPVDEAAPIIGMVADWVESAKKAGIESHADLAAIIRQRLAPFVATGEPVAKGKRLIGWRSENYLHETADRDTAINWEPHFGVLPIFEGDENTSLKAPGEPVASPLPYEWFAERSAEPWMIPIVEKWGRELERTLASRWGIKLEGGQE